MTKINFDLEAFRDRVLSDPLVYDAWDKKYRYKLPDGSSPEDTVSDTRARVVRAVYAQDSDPTAVVEALELVEKGYLVPAGRINAGAGLDRAVTLTNCFVNETVQDSMVGIQQVITRAALTMQQGGGIGTDWSTVRPAGALVKRTGSVSSGVIPFMDQMSAMCKTVVSAGTRRGAMMGTLRCDHPDLWNEEQFETTTTFSGTEILKNPSFISAKRQKDRLDQFNISVLVTDEFMQAVKDGTDWDLGFHVPRADGKHVAVYDKLLTHVTIERGADGSVVVIRSPETAAPWYVYRRLPARKIWEDIMRSTYVYAEPGVIFIDRVNQKNNLNYCETINCTNPCGEQPLPEDGTCCLGSLNLAFMVKTPFTRTSEIDWPLLRRTAIAGVRFLDNVLTVTRWPLPEQGAESDRKRRVGLGVTGFADMLAQLGVRYGSEKSVHIADDLARELKIASYTASAELAGERGSFLNFSGQILNAPNLLSLPNHVRDLIKKYGLRNGVLNTVAPNGTISLYIGNVSSGIEPIFSTTKYRRKVRQADGSLQEYEVVDYAQRLYEEMYPGSPLPSYFVGAHDVTPEEHLEVQAAWQRHIDASISKTINCSVDTSFENFETIYTRAYELGCKGVTTYRPDPIAGRGSVMSEISETSSEPAANQVAHAALRERPRVVHGATYKLKWPQNGENIYVTVNHAGREPLEVFIKHADSRLTEWTDALSRMITGVLRRGGDFRFLVDQLEQVGSANGGAFLDGKFRLSQVGAIAGVLEQEFKRLREETETIAGPVTTDGELQVTVAPRFDDPEGDICPSCNSRTFVREEGCHRCLTCGHEACG